MGVCFSATKKKEIVVKQKNQNQNENSINENDNKEKKENDLINKSEDKEDKNDNKSNKNSIISEESDKNSDEDREDTNKKNKKEKEKEKNNNIISKDIIVNYRYNAKTEFQEVFKSNDNISSLFDILLEKKSKYAEYDLTTNEYLSLSSKLNEKIGNIFPNMDNVEVNMLYLGLDISNDIKAEYEISNTVLGMPLFDLGGDIGLLIFHKIEKKFTAEIIKNHKLTKFNHLSSICNGKNILYLSGGDKTKKSGKAEPTNYFTSIDLLNTKSINDLPVLNIPRSWHSMIYIPKKYIYIIGGGALETELYDIEKNSIIIDNKMKEIRNESTLFIMNNSILYAFCGLSVDGSFITHNDKDHLQEQNHYRNHNIYNVF